MKRATREWVRKAEADYRAAKRLAKEKDPLHDQVCFLYQQTAEKYLKAIIEENGQSIPKTHDLKLLLLLVEPVFPTLRPHQRGLRTLTRFAVSTRYPGLNATKRQEASAGRVVERARQ